MSVAIPQEVPADMTTIVQDGTTVQGGHAALTAGELREALDRRTRAEFGLALDEFLARLRAGELDADSVTVADLAALAGLLARAEATHTNGNGRRRRRLRRLFA